MPYPDLTTNEIACEEWRPVVGFEDLYAISSFWRVQNIITGRLLRAELAGAPKSKYLRVTLCRNGVNRRRKLHHLVLDAFFIGPKSPGSVGNHKDGNRLNNAPENLEWTTKSGNIQHALTELGTHPHGETAPTHCLTDEIVMDMRARLGKGEQVDFQAIADRCGLDRRNVYGAAVGETWKHLPITVTQTAQYPGLAPEVRNTILYLLAEGVKQKTIAKQCNVSEALVSMIRHGQR